MSKPIVVRLTKAAAGFPKGAELGYATEAQARKVLGDDAEFTVVRHQDGSPITSEETTGAPSLKSMTRPELDAYAAELGIEGEFANKDAVIAAIEQHQASEQ